MKTSLTICLILFLSLGCTREKNVLLIGDSISIGYTPYVKEMLAEEARVYRIPGNGQDTWFGLEKLDEWLADTIRWDVIHFNWGLWDIAYRNPEAKAYGNRDKIHGKLSTSPEAYRENLDLLVKRLKETKAKLIWCSTSYVPPGEAGRFEGDEIKYNAIAAEIMKKYKVKIDDLQPVSQKVHSQYPQGPIDVHYTKEGYKMLAEQVAESIRTAMK